MPKKKTPAKDGDYDLLDRLMREYGYTLFQAKGRDRYDTLINLRTGKSTPMVCVRLLMPLTSAYGKAMDAHYRKRERQAAKPRAKARG